MIHGLPGAPHYFIVVGPEGGLSRDEVALAKRGRIYFSESRQTDFKSGNSGRGDFVHYPV